MTVEESRRNMGVERENYHNFPVGMRVLAVDDDPICLKLLEGLLRKCQYHVTTTSQAIMALKMLRENKDRFDLVISDVHMPDMDGFKLLELVGLEMDLPVIMLSANNDTKLVMKGVTHGACDYLVKPVRVEELRNIWQHVLRRNKKSDSKGQNMFDGNGEDGEGFQLTGSAEQNGMLNKKRKDEEDETNENEDPATQKKPRVVWSIELHRKFVAAVNQLGIEKAVPKRILELMNVEGLTRENVASHLQKYRLYLKRISSVATQQANMMVALRGKDSTLMRMASLDGLGDFQALPRPGRFNPATLLTYTSGDMLARLSSARNIPLAGQRASLFRGDPSSLELDQLHRSTFPDSVSVISSSTNPMMLRGSEGRGLIGGGFRNQHPPLNMASLSSELFDTNVNGSSDFLDHGRSNETWQNSIQVSEFQSAGSYPLTESFSPIGYSSSASTSTSFKDSRGESKQSEIPNHIFGSLSQGMYQSNGNSSRRINISLVHQSNGGRSSVPFQHNENETLAPDPRIRSNEDCLLVSQGFDALDDLMNAATKREQDGGMLGGEFGFDAYQFGSCL